MSRQLALFDDTTVEAPSHAPVAPVVANDQQPPATTIALDPAVRTWALHWLREKAVSWGDEAVPGSLLGCEIECSLRRCIGEDEPFATLDALVAQGIVEACEPDRYSGDRTYRLAQPERLKARGASERKESRRTAMLASEPAAPPTKKLTDRQRELLRGFEVDGLNVARCNLTEHVADWADVKAVFVALGARWQKGGKKVAGGFAFPDDADGREVLRIALESGEILDPRAAGFFPTPKALADELAAYVDPKPGDVVLEPSAGKGALALAIRRRCPEARVLCVELLPDNRKALNAEGFEVIGEDFLSMQRESVDHIISNPPFAGRADVHHITHMIEWLPVGGRLAAIASAGVLYRDDTLGRAFRAEVARHDGVMRENPSGSFIESGTSVSTVSIYLTKRGV